MEATSVPETVPVPQLPMSEGTCRRLSQTPAPSLHIREKVIFTFYYRASKRALHMRPERHRASPLTGPERCSCHLAGKVLTCPIKLYQCYLPLISCKSQFSDLFHHNRIVKLGAMQGNPNNSVAIAAVQVNQVNQGNHR